MVAHGHQRMGNASSTSNADLHRYVRRQESQGQIVGAAVVDSDRFDRQMIKPTKYLFILQTVLVFRCEYLEAGLRDRSIRYLNAKSSASQLTQAFHI